jgi:hypothetical protein
VARRYTRGPFEVEAKQGAKGRIKGTQNLTPSEPAGAVALEKPEMVNSRLKLEVAFARRSLLKVKELIARGK